MPFWVFVDWSLTKIRSFRAKVTPSSVFGAPPDRVILASTVATLAGALNVKPTATPSTYCLVAASLFALGAGSPVTAPPVQTAPESVPPVIVGAEIVGDEIVPPLMFVVSMSPEENVELVIAMSS